MFHLRLLGPLQIDQDGAPVPGFDWRKVLALLGYLIARGQPVARSHLADLFWGDKPVAQGRASLSRVLYTLSHLLPGSLRADQQTIQFLPDSTFWVDTIAFAAFVAQGEIDALVAAAELYRGDFMADMTLDDSPEFEVWLVREREHWRQRVTTVLDTLVAQHTERSEYAVALHFAMRLVTLEPWREEAHRQVMQLLALSGQRSAALVYYETCRRILAEELSVEPAVETLGLVEQIRAGKYDQVTRLPDEVVTQSPSHPVTGSPRQSWIEAPDLGSFYGREQELATLERWLVTDHCRLIALLGMGGVGKTALAAKVAQHTEHHFTCLIWRSLLNAPSLAEILRDILGSLSGYQLSDLPQSLDARLTLLIDHLRQQRCLLVLDNVESIFQGGGRAGGYRPGYEDYDQLFQHVGTTTHQSCLLLTSRERPLSLTRLLGESGPVRSLQLAGLTAEAGRAVLHERGLTGSDADIAGLVARYTGHPLALKLVAQTIQDLFGGKSGPFLRIETPIFDDIQDILDQQFARLSPLERELLTWLAIEREPVSVGALRANLVCPESPRVILETLRSLQRRSLLEQHNAGFGLPNVIIEYVTEHLVEQVCQELEGDTVPGLSNESVTLSPSHPLTLSFLNRYALVKAQAKDYVRQSQSRLILQPIARHLATHRTPARVDALGRRVLDRLRAAAPAAPGYAAGNLLNLLVQLGQDVHGYDFARLHVWQADLRGVALPAVNFTQADLTGSVFTDSFGAINGVAFSPDGQLLAAAAGDGTVRLWQAADGQPVSSYHSNAGCVWSVAFSPVSTPEAWLLASAHEDRTVRIWDVRAPGQELTGRASGHGQPRYILHGHTRWVKAVAFSPDGAILASSGGDQTVRLWDAFTGRLLQTLHTPGWVRCVAFSPDGAILACTVDDGTVRLWNLGTRQPLGTLYGHTGWVRCVAFSPDGKALASGGNDNTVFIWDTHSGLAMHTLRGHTNLVWSIAFSPNGAMLASGSEDRTIRLWDVRSGQAISRLSGHTEAVQAVAFVHSGENLANGDGVRLASGGHDQTVLLWQIHVPERSASAAHILYTLRGYNNQIRTVVFRPQSAPVLHAEGARIVATALGARVGDVAQHHLLVASYQNQTIQVWEPRAQAIQILRGHTDVVWSVAISPNGDLFATGSEDQTVRVWDAPSGQLLHILYGHDRSVVALAFSPDSTLLASGAHDQTVRIWDTRTGQVLRILHEHTDPVASVAFGSHPQAGTLLASGSHDQVIYLTDAYSGKSLRTFHGHTSRVESVAFSSDGAILASGSGDQTVRLWDVRNSQLLHTLLGHSGSVTALAFRPDGGLLASGSHDQSVRLWDARNGQLLHTLHGHTGWLTSIVFSPDSSTLVSGGDDETVRLWDVRTGTCLETIRAPRPYDGMNITGMTGVTAAQKAALKALGAVER